MTEPLTLLSFPGPDFPPVPSVTITAPARWRPQLAAGAVLATAAPEESGRFTTNVTVSWTRVAVPFDLRAFGAAVMERYRSFPDEATIGEGLAEQQPNLWIGEAAFTDPDAGTLVQTNAATAVIEEGHADVFHACGTCAATIAEEELPLLRDVVASLAVAPPG